MAYKQKGCAPITSKIKKTTQGGMVQPMLNVGRVSPAKMKGYSPLKNDPPSKDPLTDPATFADQYRAQQKAKKEQAAQKAKAQKARTEKNNRDSYNRKLKDFRKNLLLTDEQIDQRGHHTFKGDRHMSARTKTSQRDASIQKFAKNLYDYDTKNKPGSTDGYSAMEYAIAKATGSYKSKTTNYSKPAAAEKPAPKKPTSKKPTPKKTDPKKQEIKMAEVKRIARKPDAKVEKLVGNVMPAKAKTASTTATARPAVDKRTANKTARKQKSIDRKAAKAREARLEGNHKKAERKERRAKNKIRRNS